MFCVERHALDPRRVIVAVHALNFDKQLDLMFQNSIVFFSCVFKVNLRGFLFPSFAQFFDVLLFYVFI